MSMYDQNLGGPTLCCGASPIEHVGKTCAEVAQAKLDAVKEITKSFKLKNRMLHNGLAKLIEECGEVKSVAGRMLNYPDSDTCPDGRGSMREQLTKEIADVLAALQYVSEQLKLNQQVIQFRMWEKIMTYDRLAKGDESP